MDFMKLFVINHGSNINSVRKFQNLLYLINITLFLKSYLSFHHNIQHCKICNHVIRFYYFLFCVYVCVCNKKQYLYIYELVYSKPRTALRSCFYLY